DAAAAVAFPLSLHDALPISRPGSTAPTECSAPTVVCSRWRGTVVGWPSPWSSSTPPEIPPQEIDLGRATLHHVQRWRGVADLPRSEEHTSELQSRENLVCRL